MIEIVYISPTCRQTKDFIRGVWQKLKNAGMENCIMGRENTRIEIGNYVISGISLSGGYLGESRFFTKYYIDAVTHAKYDWTEARERAIKRLEYFKAGFYPRTKEILENELIKILTEETA